MGLRTRFSFRLTQRARARSGVHLADLRMGRTVRTVRGRFSNGCFTRSTGTCRSVRLVGPLPPLDSSLVEVEVDLEPLDACAEGVLGKRSVAESPRTLPSGVALLVRVGRWESPTSVSPTRSPRIRNALARVFPPSRAGAPRPQFPSRIDLHRDGLANALKGIPAGRRLGVARAFAGDMALFTPRQLAEYGRLYRAGFGAAAARAWVAGCCRGPDAAAPYGGLRPCAGALGRALGDEEVTRAATLAELEKFVLESPERACCQSTLPAHMQCLPAATPACMPSQPAAAVRAALEARTWVRDLDGTPVADDDEAPTGLVELMAAGIARVLPDSSIALVDEHVPRLLLQARPLPTAAAEPELPTALGPREVQLRAEAGHGVLRVMRGGIWSEYEWDKNAYALAGSDSLSESERAHFVDHINNAGADSSNILVWSDALGDVPQADTLQSSALAPTSPRPGAARLGAAHELAGRTVAFAGSEKGETLRAGQLLRVGSFALLDGLLVHVRKHIPPTVHVVADWSAAHSRPFKVPEQRLLTFKDDELPASALRAAHAPIADVLVLQDGGRWADDATKRRLAKLAHTRKIYTM